MSNFSKAAKNLINKRVLGLMAIVGIAGANVAKAQTAATFDVSTIVSTLTAAGVAAASIGVAYMVVVAGIKAYKMIRAAM